MSEEKSNYWTVGAYCNEEETLESAKRRAEREADNMGQNVYLYKIIGVVTAKKQETVYEWANVAPTANQQPAAEPERFKVGDEVEVNKGHEWERATIEVVGGHFYGYAFPGGGSGAMNFDICAGRIRRPAPVAPGKFVFGERCWDKEVQRECVISGYISGYNESMRTVLYDNGTIAYRTDDQLKKI